MIVRPAVPLTVLLSLSPRPIRPPHRSCLTSTQHFASSFGLRLCIFLLVYFLTPLQQQIELDGESTLGDPATSHGISDRQMAMRPRSAYDSRPYVCGVERGRQLLQLRRDPSSLLTTDAQTHRQLFCGPDKTTDLSSSIASAFNGYFLTEGRRNNPETAQRLPIAIGAIIDPTASSEGDLCETRHSPTPKKIP
ncbi:hypothetical protein CC78DRAFT_619632 [Lojkania enalia]|uniref:Uncharacterized protein n=1 Tax=Lojkania enalia TaxID=147567 RepID=A0A9P4K568_9PLEO|nr:hypothetical protein CC78DRAFT_619632 [Didymosphaeria enalia]